MSLSKKDQVFPDNSGEKNEQYIALAIAESLRKDYGKLGSAVKRISRRIGANPRAIRNWYEGRNAPNSTHLLLLAQASPAVFYTLLELLGRSDILELIQHEVAANSSLPNSAASLGEESFTIRLSISPALRCKLNQRQLWFLGMIQEGKNIRAAQIALTWGVTLRTARADIAGLAEHHLIRFKGTQKTGRYRITSPAKPLEKQRPV